MNRSAIGVISTMKEYKTNKSAPSEDLESIAEYLSKQPEKLDRSFWQEYFYWSWRCLVFVLTMVALTSVDFNESPLHWFDDISGAMWAVLILTPLLIGPVIFTGWSYVWMWGQDVLERFRHR